MAEFCSLQEIFERAKDIKDSSRYDIGSRKANDIIDVTLTAYKPAVKTSKAMFCQPQRRTGPIKRNCPLVSHPQTTAKVSNHCLNVPSGTGTPAKEGEFHWY